MEPYVLDLFKFNKTKEEPKKQPISREKTFNKKSKPKVEEYKPKPYLGERSLLDSNKNE